MDDKCAQSPYLYLYSFKSWSSQASEQRVLATFGTIQDARHKTVEFPWKFHGDEIVEFSVEFPQKVRQRLNRGTFCAISTETKSWQLLLNLSPSGGTTSFYWTYPTLPSPSKCRDCTAPNKTVTTTVLELSRKNSALSIRVILKSNFQAPVDMGSEQKFLSLTIWILA